MNFGKISLLLFLFATITLNDLAEFDAQVTEFSLKMGQYLNLACLATTKANHLCLLDRTGFIQDPHNELFIFLAMAQERAYHLKIAIDVIDQRIMEMEELYGLGDTPGIKK